MIKLQIIFDAAKIQATHNNTTTIITIIIISMRIVSMKKKRSKTKQNYDKPIQ